MTINYEMSEFPIEQSTVRWHPNSQP